MKAEQSTELKAAVLALRKASSLINAQRLALRKSDSVSDARDEMGLASRSLDLAIMFLRAEINDASQHSDDARGAAR